MEQLVGIACEIRASDPKSYKFYKGASGTCKALEEVCM